MNLYPAHNRNCKMVMRTLDKNHLSASYFASISYMCCAFRRQGVTLDAARKIGKWLY